MSGVFGAALASIPSPPWNNLEIGPLNLRFYGLMIALGVIAAVWLLGKQLEAHRLGTTDDAGSIAVWGVVAGVIGARLYHVATDWSRFSDDLAAIPKIWQGGLGIPGGLIAGIIFGLVQSKRRGLRAGVAMTFAAPAIALAQSIARWGNWFNQELFGKPTTLPWGLEIDVEHLPAGYAPGTTFHPAFLYESVWNLGLCLVLLRVQRRFQLAPGRLLAVYAIGYGAGRFWIEGLRIDPAHDLGGLRWNQWVALAAIVVGVVALLLTRGRTWDVDPARDATFPMRALAGDAADGDADPVIDHATDETDDGWVDPALVALGAASAAAASSEAREDEPSDAVADSGPDDSSSVDGADASSGD